MPALCASLQSYIAPETCAVLLTEILHCPSFITSKVLPKNSYTKLPCESFTAPHF